MFLGKDLHSRKYEFPLKMENKSNQKVTSRNISLLRLGISQLENLFLHQTTEGLSAIQHSKAVNN